MVQGRSAGDRGDFGDGERGASGDGGERRPERREISSYPKARPTCADALVRRSLSVALTVQLSAPDMVKVPRGLLERFHALLAYTA